MQTVRVLAEERKLAGAKEMVVETLIGKGYFFELSEKQDELMVNGVAVDGGDANVSERDMVAVSVMAVAVDYVVAAVMASVEVTHELKSVVRDFVITVFAILLEENGRVALFAKAICADINVSVDFVLNCNYAVDFD